MTMTREDVHKHVVAVLLEYLNSEIDLRYITASLPVIMHDWSADEITKALIYAGHDSEAVWDMIDDKGIDTPTGEIPDKYVYQVHDWVSHNEGVVSGLIHNIIDTLLNTAFDQGGL